MNFRKPLAASVVIAFVCTLTAAGCSGEPPAPAAVEVVYRCAETGKYFAAPSQPAPAVNPDTGRATLQRALYCPRCARWHVVPPPEVRNGPPASYPCPKHNIAMQEQGPLPE